MAAAAASPYLAGGHGSFVADDWAQLGNAMHLDAERLPRALFGTTDGWYRPLPMVLWAVQWRSFGLSATSYHHAAWMLYVLTTVLVGAGAWQLSGRPSATVVGAALFATFGSHSEPALWLSAANELVAATFILCAAISFLVYARSGDRVPAAATMGGLALALASKESAAFLPAWFLYMEVAVWRRRPSAVTLSCALLGALFVIWRWHGGSPYSSDLSPWTIPPNLLYYAGVSLAGVPEHYAYRSGLGLWRSSPVLGVASVAMVTAAWLALLAGKRVRRPSGAARPLVTAGVGWAVCALLPVIGVAAGRTLYVPSIGLAWVLAGLALEVPPRRAATAVALMVSAGLLQTRDRVAYWNMAGEVTAGLIRSVEVVRAESPDAVVCLEDLPDHVRHAYVFRNALPALNEVMWPAGRVVEAKGQGEECDVRVSPPPAH